MDKDLVKIFKALGNKRRLNIISFLKKKRIASVGEIATVIKLSLTSTSKHLNILYSLGLLDKEQRNLQIFYFISTTPPKILITILKNL